MCAYKNNSRGRGNSYQSQNFNQSQMAQFNEPMDGFRFQPSYRPPRRNAMAKQTPKSPASQRYQKQRDEDYREKVGKQVLEAAILDFKKTLLMGFDSIDEVIKMKDYKTQIVPKPIMTTTRGIGFSVNEIFHHAKDFCPSIRDARVEVCTVYQMYRVELAMAEERIFKNKAENEIFNATQWYAPQKFEPYKNVITSNRICTQRTGALIKSSGAFDYQEQRIVPLYPSGRMKNDRYAPTPECTHFSNLEETIRALSDERTDVQVRQNYRQHSALPEAEWSANHVLLNPQDFWPDGYSPEVLSRELYKYRQWLSVVTDWKPKLFTNITTVRSGGEPIFVSNNPTSLKCREKGVNSDPVVGDVKIFWTMNQIPETMMFFGVYILGGEVPTLNYYMSPCGTGRLRDYAYAKTERLWTGLVAAVER